MPDETQNLPVEIEDRKLPVEIRDLYKTLLDTRNLEINLFWQRSNYFLVLNSGIALGFFNLKDQKYGVIFAVMGLLASMLWFWVCLGGKYWQTWWIQRLREFEIEHMPELEFFGASRERIRAGVEEGFAFHNLGWTQRLIYRLALNQRPSVTYSMIRLSALFVFGWVAFIFITLLLGRNPIG